ncbi:hypothetical protein CRM22_009034 [Opisthorchis felineus]|uniref:C2 domain-containing protein n=1 Tax=Opisthorchis felineus TaxID=147828 RepID=A0A4S2LGJ4_OPIFE|nr:hypothetical protein CRM22_009034 [Opisthorchis felineus]
MAAYALEVLVKCGVNLPNVEITGKSDPYVVIEYQGLKKETKVIDDNLNPVWNETLSIDLQGRPLSSADVMTVTVKDFDKVTADKFMGMTEVPLRNLIAGAKELPVKAYLKDKKGKETTGSIELVVKYIAPESGGDVGAGTVVDQGGGDGGGGGASGGDGGGETGGYVDYAETAAHVSGTVGSSAGTVRRRSKEPYSTKPQDFQIRVKVVEARQLQGNNIPPVCKIICAGSQKETKVKSQTNSPYWDETFYFNFYEAAATLFEKLIVFGVYHSKKMRKDALIGSFKFDLGLVYDQDKHALLNKWLLLCDPDDTMSGCKGYLKVSVIIVGPGDEPPSLKVENGDKDDIETNLLRPAGVQLQPAIFKIRIYSAEDLPQMDPDTLKGIRTSKDESEAFVDPFVKVSFAGTTQSTSKKYGTDRPEWNEEIIINFQFPSMCDKVSLTLYDWDRVGDDDAIATAPIFLSQVSAYRDESDGFLPTFGPSYITLYGSPREYQDIEDKYKRLNKGKGDGAAYRGRILVELKTELLDDPIPDQVRPIEPDVVARTQKCCRRRKFRLQTAFLSATQMPGEKDDPVEFEVSVGNYGYKLDNSVPPCPSITPPTNPVYDGMAYSFLPWQDDKPCTVVDPQFEDITFRLFAVNMMQHMAAKLSENLVKLEWAIRAKAAQEHLANLAISALDQFILDCGKQLPSWEPENSPVNEMDRHMKELRMDQIARLGQDAAEARETLASIEDAVALMQDYLAIVKQLSMEPQLSFPDIVIWMLSGGKRKAYYRIPAHEVLYSETPHFAGLKCSKTQVLNFKQLRLYDESEDKFFRIPVQVTAIFWLGFEKNQTAWKEQWHEAKQRVVAETYENQASTFGSYSSRRPPLTRYAWSDSAGKKELKKELFHPPTGWDWDGDWYVDPELSVLIKQDAGQTTYVEEVFCNETRTPETEWQPAKPCYTDDIGNEREAPDRMVLEPGWSWDGDWHVDLGRLCDEDGYEYSISQTERNFQPTEHLEHMFRRKRMTRKRVFGEAGTPVKGAMVASILEPQLQQRLSLLDSMSTSKTEAWEYAFNFDSKFHLKEKGTDMVRRRRWHRNLKQKQPGGSTEFVMHLSVDSSPEDVKKSKKKENLTVPRIYLSFERPHEWQLRAYIFQARNLLALDQSGWSDPYVFCSFQGMCLRTETLQQTICPTWDQTLIFERVRIYGAPEAVQISPPTVTLEFFDQDQVGKDEYMGHCEVHPIVVLDMKQPRKTNLFWYKIYKGSKDGGDLLAALEMILIDGQESPVPPPRRGDIYRVPDVIRPKLRRTGIEILCWGVRNMAKYELASVNSPSVEFEIAGEQVESKKLKSAKDNPNFDDPVLFLDVMLPVVDLYSPPLNITVVDHRAFGQRPKVGRHVLTSLNDYRVNPRTTEIDPVLLVPGLRERLELPIPEVPEYARVQLLAATPGEREEAQKKTHKKQFVARDQLDLEQIDDEVDWWSKYYASLGEWGRCRNYRELGYDTLQILNGPLEKEEEFHEFKDFCNNLPLKAIKKSSEDADDEVGYFKGTFRIYALPEDPKADLPVRYFKDLMVTPKPEECIVRVYIVKATDLQPNDPSGLADPYIEIKLGNKKVHSKDKYLPNTLNPEFGLMFELKCRLPVEKDLRIRVMDYDMIGANDTIGETYIDLENRRLTKYRATCGIPQSYYIDGPNQWRDAKVPTALLMDMCRSYGLPPPEFSEPDENNSSPSCRLRTKVFTLDQFEHGLVPNPHRGPPKERLALHILNILPLVKEHVESRPLFNPVQPDLEQGRLHMWVDLFPVSDGPPGPAIDISPRQPSPYVLRIVVWNTVEVVLQEANLFGEKMSDIFVKGWISGVDERQKTDVHYRSLNGEGNFNWRFVFPFDYMPAENMLVVRRKESFFSLDATERRLPPVLIMQVWDNDLFNPNDFLGTLELKLSNMPAPAKNAKLCTLNMMQSAGSDNQMINLFDSRRTKGFWPFMNEQDGTAVLTGKIEMELEIVTKEEEALRPAGRARDEPNLNPKLDPPNRPATSFLWITSPWKSFKYIIWKNCKWVFIGILIAILVGLLLALFIYAIPQLLARKMVGV